MKKKMFMSALALAVATSALVQTVQVDAATSSFKDVPTTHYAHQEIISLVDRGVIKGFTDGTFKPTKQVTRAEFAAFVARALELPTASSNFKDVPKSAALYDGVSRANKAGLIKGFSNGTFKPNTPVNRQDMAVMLDRALQMKGAYTKTKALTFADKASVGSYAKTSVERMVYYNIMGAYSPNRFEANMIGNRAETVISIYNMLEVRNDVVIKPPVVTPPTNNGSPNHGDVKTIKGIKFVFDGMWVDEYGISYGELPKKTHEIVKGHKYSYRISNDPNYAGSYFISYLIQMDLDFEKNEFLSIMNDVHKTGKTTVSKGIKFYLPDPKDKSHIQFTLN